MATKLITPAAACLSGVIIGVTLFHPSPSLASPTQAPQSQLGVRADIDVREALRSLFRSVGTSYSIASDIQGTVTPLPGSRTFDERLTAILKQVNATYKFEGGVYEVVSLHPSLDLTAGPDVISIVGSVPSGPPAITTDESFVYVVSGATLFKISKVDLKIVARVSLPERILTRSGSNPVR
jgi:type II secretory pathway component GspD/PulD (secretin)